MAFTIPVYCAILTGRRHADVLTLHETSEAAVRQCRQWICQVPDAQPDQVSGYLFFCQYGTSEETVRVERQWLELEDSPPTDEDEEVPYVPGPTGAAPVFPRAWVPPVPPRTDEVPDA